jgi:phosphoenolpyruvate synthase/pyruvate phosphate dikinase
VKYVHDLSASACARRSVAGGKGAGLHKLVKLGYRVPPGFVLSARAFDRFLEYNGLTSKVEESLRTMRSSRASSIVLVSRKLQRALLNASFPPDLRKEVDAMARNYGGTSFAVRSSVSFEDGRTHSWAGQFDSFLGIDASALAEHVQKCWASLFNRRAMIYEPAAYQNDGSLSMGVVIQIMVESTSAGVAFSISPSNPNQMLIEAVRGRGDKLVSGKEHSWSAVVNKIDRKIVSIHASAAKNANLLSVREVNQLTRVLSEIDRKLRCPVDVEWALAGKHLFLLQVRRITTKASLHNGHDIELPDVRDYELTFKVTGLSYLFTDMLSRGFKYLDPLFTSDEKGTFCQYFRKNRMEYAERFGIRWLSTPKSVESYRAEFTAFYNRSRPKLDVTAGSGPLSKVTVQRFFRVMSRLLMLYSRTDNEFTDTAYLKKDESPTVAENLKALGEFKDIARVWINSSAIEDQSPFSRLCVRLSDRFSIPRDELECYSVHELMNAFDGFRMLRQDVRDRKRSFSMFFADGRHVILQGQKSLKLIQSINVVENVAAGEVLMGRVANRTQAVVTGKVIVINVDYGNMDEMNRTIKRMRKGDVLVAEFTAPELLEACKKAKAIVTDIGGLLSHAAIVSREFGIPCLVGTGFATKWFHTGDDVVIDFTSGTVRGVNTSSARARGAKKSS